jgi:hypothetical protein
MTTVLQRLREKGPAERPVTEGYTVHGFRSSFRDWCGDVADVPREIAEAALAHVVAGTKAHIVAGRHWSGVGS